MALFLPITCVILILAISRYDLLETRSIARSKVFEASGDAILMMNLQNRVLDFNGSAKRLFAQLDIRLENKNMADLFAGNDVLLSVLSGTNPAVVKLKTGGKERYYDISTEQIGEGKLLRGKIKIFRDVTDIYQLNEELSRLAMTDELSVLSNRRAFLKIGREWIDRSDAQGSSLYLLMMDLDFFKNVNDRFGHPTGDLVIHEFSQMLMEHFGPQSLIARLGGEEFAVMLEGVTEDAVLGLIESLLTKTAHHTYSYFGNKFNVTVSVGMTKREPGQQLEGMMRRADRALYGSKDRGRRCVTVM
jgi:diguanylate cyclase (GGDEF)-like protein